MPDAYSYVRYSTPEQMRGDSLRRQTKLSEKFAADHGLTLVRNYHDLGISGYRGANREKGALRLFLDSVEDGRIKPGSWLLVESLDRLSRDEVDEALPRFIDLLKANIVIATLVDGRIYDRKSVKDPLQLVGSLIVMARAHEESAMKSHRTLEAWKARREKGVVAALCPAWLRVDTDGRTYHPIPERVQILKEIFELSAAGLGSSMIAKQLNDRGVPPFSKKLDGKPRAGREARGWHPGSVLDLLTSRAVLGERQYFNRVGHRKVPVGDPVLDHYPPVIEQAFFDRAATARRRQPKRGRKGASYANLFQGIIWCDSCGGPMIISHGARQTRKYLRCGNAQAGIQCESLGASYFNAGQVENAVLDHVREYRLSELFANPVTDHELRKIEGEHAVVAIKIADLERQQATIMERIAKLTYDDPLVEDYEKAMRGNRAEIARSKGIANTLAQKRADLAVQQDQRANSEEEILKLRAELAAAHDQVRVVQIRAKLAAALKTFIDMVRCDGSQGTVDVILLGGMIAYRFRRSAKRHGPAKDYSITFEQRVSLVGTHPVEAFVNSDDERLRYFGSAS